jgi:hypothetical protein
MKCFDCVCAIQDEDNGLWCAKYKSHPTGEMAEKCGHFLDRGAIGLHRREKEACQ